MRRHEHGVSSSSDKGSGWMRARRRESGHREGSSRRTIRCDERHQHELNATAIASTQLLMQRHEHGASSGSDEGPSRMGRGGARQAAEKGDVEEAVVVACGIS